ncbi:MAG: DNA ligase D [Proteobacteria bacterium]|nr:DNA ligase D [Pseudomonadota bacterium]
MSDNSQRDDGLKEYRARRDAEGTPEPFGHQVDEHRTGGSGIFVVQLHAARRRHYDFRIELGGVLVSWAIPRGPSLDPAEKRLAIWVENHPLEYATFEGAIPEGNYGAGTVVVWDTGVWVPIEDPVNGLKEGKLLFDLHGHKLRGRWTLVRTRASGHASGTVAPESSKEWLLIKKSDGFADPKGQRPPGDESIYSGLTVEELAGAADREQAISRRIADLGVYRRDLDVKKIEPMLCQTAEAPFSQSDWIYELKYDGYRLLAAKMGKASSDDPLHEVRSPEPTSPGRRSSDESPRLPASARSDDGVVAGGSAGEPYLRYRSGLPASHIFPDLVRAIAALPYSSFILDGEVVVLDEEGKPVFSRLQGRTQLQRPVDIRRASMLEPVTMVVFDLLAFGGYDLRSLPLSERKSLLREMLPRVGPLRYADHILGRGEEFYRAVVDRGLEGVVAKRVDSTYQGQRSDKWLKIRSDRTDDFAVVGYTSPQGTRVGFGSLHLAVWHGHKWVYAGRVGSGFGGRELEVLSESLRELRPWEPTFAPPSSPQREDHWIEPKLVCTVKYSDWPEGSHLRFPRFLHLRGDKRPRDCLLPAYVAARDLPAGRQASETPAADRADPQGQDGASGTTELARTSDNASGPDDREDPRHVSFSNVDKVFWPATDDCPAYTKGDLIDYYRYIAPWILPYLRERPVVLTRYPNGVDGKSFFQKDAPSWVPDWIRTETLWSKHAQREIHYFVCEDVETLLYLANMGTIPLHIWSSRVETLSQPDWAVLDLDPKGAPFDHVVTVARAIHSLCRDLEMRCFIKTSGATGLHILLPLAGACTYQQSRTLALLLAKVVESEMPDLATTQRSIEKRNGRVYLDYVQNGHGRLIAAPYSVRPLPGAPVSMPLRWSEVTPKLDVSRFTITTAVRRMRRLTSDPLHDVLEVGSDLAHALNLLGKRVKGQS